MKLRGILLVCALALPVVADEGMWLFNQFPKSQVQQKYSVKVTDAFLEHLRLSSVRIGGGSGSFVSPHGLIFTNHHVASDCISKLGSAQHDYMKEGFSAAGPPQELPCPDMEANVLVALDDVTQQVKEAAKDETVPAEALQKRRAAIARLEKECIDKTGNNCAVVKFFSGHPDNFTYPRYDLDIAFLRAYENGQPASTPQYLAWSATGVKDADLVFVAGNPATTSRLATGSQLAFYRDAQLPLQLARLQTRRGILREYGKQNEENRRAAQRALFGFSNSFKSLAGKLI